jgi:high-affinity iron transporter
LLPSFLLSLREGLEAALIIGIVLGALRQVERKDLHKTVWLGAFSAAVICVLAAFGLNALGVSLQDPGEAIFEGFTMLLAAAVLTWMIFWMSRQARQQKNNIEEEVRKASGSGGGGLFFLAFLAVLREGLELALFLTAAGFSADARQVLPGALLGLAAAVLLGLLLFLTTVRLNLRLFFQVTGFLLILFAAGLLAHGVHEFNELGWFPAVIEHLWDVNPILDESSPLGRTLQSLLGYNGNPSLTEVLAYVLYFVAVLLGLRKVGKRTPVLTTG